jgi:hypothetical protein
MRLMEVSQWVYQYLYQYQYMNIEQQVMLSSCIIAMLKQSNVY